MVLKKKTISLEEIMLFFFCTWTTCGSCRGQHPHSSLTVKAGVRLVKDPALETGVLDLVKAPLGEFRKVWIKCAIHR